MNPALNTLLALALRIALVLAAGALFIWVVSVLERPGEGDLALDPSSTVLDAPWTSEPVRVDRGRQDYEVVHNPLLAVESDLHRFVIQMPRRPELADSASFLIDGDIFLVDGVTGYRRQELCTDGAGRRSACGNRAIAGMISLLADKRLRCRRASIGRNLYIVSCKIGHRELAAEMLRNGLGRPTGRYLK
ncbi:MAG: hypothetical protein ACK4U0_15155 [Mesorhizobium sp.]